MVRSVAREDAQWNRPIFKAPPLNVVVPQIFDATIFAEDLRRDGPSSR